MSNIMTLINAGADLTQDDKECINNQIEIINEISLKGQSNIANMILFDMLVLSIAYYYCYLSENDIFENLNINNKINRNSVVKAINLLVENQILTKTKNDNIIYYRLNEQYFIDNKI